MDKKYYQSNKQELDQNPSSKFKYFEYIMKAVNGLKGTFVELGTYKAETAGIFISLANKNIITKRDLWLYDSFKGFPELSAEDISIRKAKKGDLCINTAKAELLKTKTKTNVNIVPGYFQDTLPHTYIGGQIAILHLDCDLYDSYKIGLESLYDNVVPGGLIIFDEYKYKMDLLHWPGASKAIDEFFKDIDIKILKYKLHGSLVEKYYAYKP